MLSEKLLSLFKEDKLILDFGGHLCSKGEIKYNNKLLDFCYNKDGFLQNQVFSSIEFFSSMLEKMNEAIDNNDFKGIADKFSDPNYYLQNLGKKSLKLSSIRCSECGKDFTLVYDGKKVYSETKCEFPGGIKPWTETLKVPSGKLVFRNDMRDAFPTNESFYVNDTCEIKACEKYYASIGMFHVFVGNTSPNIYTMNDGRIIIGNLEDDRGKLLSKYSGAKKLGFICTDLWWFSACDYDEFIKRYGKKPSKVGWVKDVIVKMPGGPGKYRLKSYYSTSKNRDSLKEYAVINKIK